VKNILVPTDFSEESEAALKVALELSERMKEPEVILLNVVDPPEGYDFTAQGVSTNYSLEDIFTLKLIEKMRNDLEEVADQYGEDAPIYTELALGDTIQKINDKVLQDEADLVVMGTKGARGIQGALAGSNAERVVRSAHCPVLTVKTDNPYVPCKNLLFASRFDEPLDHVVPHIKAFQQLFDARLHLLYVNTPRHFETTTASMTRIREFADAHQFQNYDIHIFNHREEEDGILSFAEEENMDIVSVATHSRTGFSHLLNGSIAEGLANHSNKPVLTFSIKHIGQPA
jgi:nucleotide-binding universal stress UspA family protein